MNMNIQKNPDNVVQLNMLEIVQMATVRRDKWAIKHINAPSLAVCVTAVNRYEHAIEYIDTPTASLIQLHNMLWNSQSVCELVI